ncbi:MAG: hypothetical protein F6K39_42660 [Okeania sp. SIO3B3]|nr:hypothetical protein [Okeania sp. SIO3B3]
MTNSIEQQLKVLALSLNERLSPSESDAFAEVLQMQSELQSVLHLALLDSPTDKFAHAQALEYARDLAKTMREQKESKRRLELTWQQLIRAEKLASVGQIAAAVAHELGNIVSPLLMYANLIHQEASAKKDESVAEFALQITEIAQRASDMLRQLVDAARNEPDMMLSVDVQQIMHNVLSLLNPQLRRQQIVASEHYSVTPAPVRARPDQLEQVFINVVLNAIDAMPDGGQLTVSIEADSNFVTVQVMDTGVGIPVENIAHLFEPFFTTKARGAGTGLGLFVSHQIIDRHGGAIEVDSEQNGGTTFVIKLPRDEEVYYNDKGFYH